MMTVPSPWQSLILVALFYVFKYQETHKKSKAGIGALFIFAEVLWTRNSYMSIRQKRSMGATNSTITCSENIDLSPFDDFERRAAYELFEETMEFLREYKTMLTQQVNEGCDGAWLSTSSVSGTHKCGTELIDIIDLVHSLDTLIRKENEQQVKECFDPFMRGLPKEHRGYTPSAEMKVPGSVTWAINRPTFEDIVATQTLEHEVAESLLDFGNTFMGDLDKTGPVLGSLVNASARNPRLARLWRAAPWIPMYIHRESAGNARFRSGYAFAEIVGAYGMLGITHIDGKPFAAQVGFTMQRQGTRYKSHFHHARELYISLTETPESCPNHVQYYLTESSKKSGDWKDMKKDDLQTYGVWIESNHLHAFRVADCGGPMIAAWARVGVDMKHDQGTYMLDYH